MRAPSTASDWYGLMAALPAAPYEARSFRSLSAPTSRRNGSSEARQANAPEGKKPHLRSGPNREEPSRRPVTVKM